MKYILFLLVFILSFIAGTAQTSRIEKEKFHFGQDQDTVNGYTQAIKVGNTIYVSGTVAVELTPQAVKTLYGTIAMTLNRFGASLENIVKETIFTIDIEGLKKVNAVRKEMYKGDYPASTWVQINRLFMPEAKIEIEVVAHVAGK